MKTELLDLSRTEALIGEPEVCRLREAVVAVFGVGGVGSFAAEALARTGIGTLILVDNDVVKPSNCNRQLVALQSTIGKYKTQVMKERILDINPEARVVCHEVFYNKETADRILEGRIDYVVDAIDSLDSKVHLILECQRREIPVLSAMGAGNKLHPECFEVTDLFKTSYDPIAKILRKRLKDIGVKKLQVVCSTEQPKKTTAQEDGKRVPASIAFVPSACGLIMAGVVVRALIQGVS